MNELAHWLVGVGNGLLAGLWILGVLTLLGWLAEAMPLHVPVLTPVWNGIKATIRRPIEWLDARLTRGRR